MKKLVLVLTLAAACVFLTNLFAQEFTYVGSAKCKICHKSEKQGLQFPIWEESMHSKSIAALSSPDAAAKAEEMGVENPAESPKCLKCHGPLSEKASDFKDEGVTCEVCHGPGSAYKSLSVMKSRDGSVAKGLVVNDTPEKKKEWCLTCHGDAHGTPFDFEASWEKIKHLVPEKQ
jgi:hypothetical protein